MCIISYQIPEMALTTSVKNSVKQGAETFAIIYETDENYYISPCVIENEKIVEINVDTKDVIAKEGTQYKHFHYKTEK